MMFLKTAWGLMKKQLVFRFLLIRIARNHISVQLLCVKQRSFCFDGIISLLLQIPTTGFVKQGDFLYMKATGIVRRIEVRVIITQK